MTADVTLYYWPTILGRGEFVRLVLEEAGVAYRDVGREKGFGPVAEKLGGDVAAGPFAPFAPPYIEADGITVFQTANICAFLGEKHGLAPANVPNAEQARLFARGLAMTMEDFAREAHDVHHPISVNLYYEDQKDEALRRAEDFRTERLPKFLGYFEAVVETAGHGWLIGKSITYPDLYLFQVLEGLAYAFPKAMAREMKDCPNLAALRDAAAARPHIAKYLKSKRRMAFNEDGLFRHYPELDG